MASATIPRSLLDEYNAKVEAVGEFAWRSTREVLATWMRSHPEASVAEVREYAKLCLQSAGELFGSVAEEHAYQLIESVAELAGEDGPSADDLWHYEPDPDVVNSTARYHAGELVQGHVDAFLDAIADAASALSKRGANETMIHQGDVQDRSANRRRKRKTIRYARVPQGMSNCPFCVMMASRGFVYLTRDSAGELPGGFNRFHLHCDCKVVPGFDGMHVEGYDPEKLYRRYRACRETVEHSFDADWKALGEVEQARYKSYNDYVEKRIIKEMRTRDLTWINGGPGPEADYSEKPRESLEPHEQRAIDLFSEKQGVFVTTKIEEEGKRNLDFKIWNDLWELKSPGSGRHAVDDRLTDAFHKFRDMGDPHPMIIICNSESNREDNDVLDECLRRIRHRVRAAPIDGVGFIFLGHDGNMMRRYSI